MKPVGQNAGVWEMCCSSSVINRLTPGVLKALAVDPFMVIVYGTKIK